MLKLDYAVASDRGLVRSNNEDSAYAGPYLLALADGMGGHAAGEIASQLMINHLRALDTYPGDNDMLALLGMVADEANAALAEGIREDATRDGMGTTLTAFMFNGRELGMCHVGDSRAYLLRDGQLTQLTVDDTFVQSLVAEGKLDPEDVSTHPQRSLILKAYTGHPVQPTLQNIPALAGDRLLLCSDGLSDPVTHSTIEETMRTGTPQDATRRLVELALRSGGPDNVTVVIADIVEVDGDDPSVVGTAPVTAGALNGEQPDDARPDTAASRAAAISRQPKSIEPVPEIAQPPEKTSSKLPVLVVALVVLIGLVAAGWWGYTRIQATYFVTTSAEDTITVEQGVDYRIFGFDLHEPYKVACIDRNGQLTLVDNCTTDPPFTLDDLPENLRGSIQDLPSGSYDDVQAQMQRLAQQALPVCVSTQEGGFRDRPGVNCREVS